MKISEHTKQIFWALVDVVLGFILFAGLSTWIHEAMHANVTRWLGGTGYSVVGWFGGYFVPQGIGGLSIIAVAFSGGLGTALIFYFMQAKWLEEESDYYFRIPCRFFMLNNLIYGIGEGLWMAGAVPSIYDFALFASVASVLILAGWYLFYSPR